MVKKDTSLKEPTFTKEQLVKAKIFHKHTDLLNALLKEGVQYTVKDAESIVVNFLKKEVR